MDETIITPSNVVALNVEALSSRVDVNNTTRAIDGDWSDDSILFVMMAALSRRVLHKNTPATTMVWTMSDEGDPSILRSNPSTGTITRYFERTNGVIRCNLEFSHYLTHVGSDLHPETDLPKTLKYNFHGRNLRDIFRSYLPPHAFQILLTLYFHHLPKVAAIRRSWEEADFEYYLTISSKHPRSHPPFDYDYIEGLAEQLTRGISERSVAERRKNRTSTEFDVLPFSPVRGDAHA